MSKPLTVDRVRGPVLRAMWADPRRLGYGAGRDPGGRAVTTPTHATVRRPADRHAPYTADKDRYLAAMAIATRRLPRTIGRLIAAEICFFLQHPWLGAQPQLRALISELEHLDQEAADVR